MTNQPHDTSNDTEHTTRANHLQWCKNRALQELEYSGTDAAYASMVSDLGKHPETCNHAATEIGLLLMLNGNLNTPQAMQKFIHGFN